jgi:drug/metabolite transporter (DMT)-like permease
MLVGGLVLHLLSLAAGERVPASVAEPAAVGAVAYLGLFSTALAFIIYFTILNDRGAFEASLVAYLVPVVATVVGVAVLGETVGVLSLVGFLVVFLGFALLKRRGLVDMVGAGVS